MAISKGGTNSVASHPRPSGCRSRYQACCEQMVSCMGQMHLFIFLSLTGFDGAMIPAGTRDDAPQRAVATAGPS
ncbi:hypothetical protein BH160DRAFT_6336 [Burkholderia sp. H160]|nr:hypothetical protein BH160DRAFT_6336 [Burkholderia sp. H160]